MFEGKFKEEVRTVNVRLTRTIKMNRKEIPQILSKGKKIKQTHNRMCKE